MMKPQPSATKLNLSRLCRGIMVLALFKISLFSAIIFDTTLVDFASLTFYNTSAIAKEKNNSSASMQSVSNKNTQQMQRVSNKIETTQKKTNNLASIKNNNTHNAKSVDTSLNNRTQQAINQNMYNPNISNWDTNNGTFPVSTATPGENNSSPSFFSTNDNTMSLEYELLSAGIDSSNTRASVVNVKKSWWQNMLNVKNLPIPSFGTASVAHAAALDNPPDPNITAPTGVTNFTPSSQRVDEQQQAAQVAANAKPYSTAAATNNYQPNQTNDITKSTTPPAPNVNAYTPVEDVNFKQKELIRREQELLMLKKQMEQRYAELKIAEEKVNKLLQSAGNTNKKQQSALVNVYANMKPKQAAQALGKIDERVAVKILTGLNPKQAGEILSYADPEVTAKLTELLTRVQN